MTSHNQRQTWTDAERGLARGGMHPSAPAVDDVQDWSSLRARAGIYRTNRRMQPVVPTNSKVTCRGFRASALSRRTDNPLVRAAGTFFHTLVLSLGLERRRPTGCHSLTNRPAVTLSRRVIRCRRQFLRIAQQTRQDRVDPPKTHQSVLSCAVVVFDRHDAWKGRGSAQESVGVFQYVDR